MAKSRTIVENINEVVEGITTTTSATAIETNPETPVTTSASQEGTTVTATATEENKGEVKALSYDDLTEDQIMEIAAKRGLSVSKKNDELSAEEKQKMEQVEEAEKLTFAVQSGLITPERYVELKSIIKEDGLELTKKEFVKAFKAENKDASEKDIQAAYSDYYNLNGEIPQVEEGEEPIAPKYDERQVKWGQVRQQTKAERIKENAKSVLDSIDTNYKNYKAFQSKANDYGKNVESVIAEIPTDNYEAIVKRGKENIKVAIELPKEVKANLNEYLIKQIGSSVIQANEKVTKEQVKTLADSFIRNAYEDAIMDKFYEVAKSEGLREAKAGVNAPIVITTFQGQGEDEELKRQVDSVIPLPLQGMNLSRNNKNKS